MNTATVSAPAINLIRRRDLFSSHIVLTALKQSVVMLRPDGKSPSGQGIESAFANYGRLSASTAQRVVRFWQVKQNR